MKTSLIRFFNLEKKKFQLRKNAYTCVRLIATMSDTIHSLRDIVNRISLIQVSY